MFAKKKIALYTIMHFLVDFACIFHLFAYIWPRWPGSEAWIIFVVLYNFMAFAFPALVGLLSDIIDANYLLAGVGCAIVGLSSLLFLPMFLQVILAGLGNGMFHIAIGRQVLTDAQGKFSQPGIFICSGAMGVFLGTTLANRGLHPLNYILTVSMVLFAIYLIISGVKILFKDDNINKTSHSLEHDNTVKYEFLFSAAVLVFIVVFLRSFYGRMAIYSWKNTFLISLLFTSCIIAGKALGGVIADKIGITTTTIISLGGAAITVLFSADNMFFGYVSIFLFNMTMPLTLTLISECWKGYPGLAFGILMLALFLGGLPSLAFQGVTMSVFGLSIVSICSMFILLKAIMLKRRKD